MRLLGNNSTEACNIKLLYSFVTKIISERELDGVVQHELLADVRKRDAAAESLLQQPDAPIRRAELHRPRQRNRFLQHFPMPGLINIF